MSLLKYLNNNQVTKQSFTEYYNVITELKKKDIIDLYTYTCMNDFIKEPSINNISWLLGILNKNSTEDEQIKIMESFPKLISRTNKLVLNENIYNNLIDNKYLSFSENQKAALMKLISFIKNHKQNTFGLYGYAGTGKTTTIVEFIAYLLENKLIRTVALTAPTNKAVNVIKSKFKHHLNRLSGMNNLPFDDMVMSLEKKGIKIDFITIHKLLNYKNDFDTDGDKVFLRNGNTTLNDYDIVIIDECSMIPHMIINNIFEDIREIKKKSSIRVPKVLFSGDVCQLPPVNELKSIIFLNIFKGIKLNEIISFNEMKKNTSKENKFNIEFTKEEYDKIILELESELIYMKYFTLTEVVRTKLSNVISLCYNIREWIDNLIKFPKIRDYVGEGVYVYKKSNDKTETEWFKKYLEYNKSTTQEHSSNIILAWTNKQCNIYNETVRNIIFKDKQIINKYEIGDILILNDFYVMDETKSYVKDKEKDNRLYTSEQIKITDLEIITKKNNPFSITLPKQLQELKNISKIETKFKQYVNKINNFSKREYKCWRIFVQKIQDTDTIQLYIIHDDSIKLLESDKLKTLGEIKKLKWELEKIPEYTKTIEKYILNQLWKEFHSIYNIPFANVNIGCSISCHKSQSSTYFNVFVDADDILNNMNGDEAKRCIYTAITRASNTVHILI